MHRVYFLSELGQTEAIINNLRSVGFDNDEIHLIAKDEDLAARCKVADATMDEASDVDNASTRGMATGAATGALAGLLVTLAPGGLILGGGAIALAAAVGGGLGLSVGTIVGASEEHPIKAEYQEAIESGKVLFAVDTPAGGDDELEAAVHAVDPSIKLQQRTLTGVEKPE